MSKINKPRLGRGLSSLLSVDLPADPPAPAPAFHVGDAAPLPGDRLEQVGTHLILPNPSQPRREFDEAGLKELAASLKVNGFVQPLVVRQKDARYELIAGERRLRAAKLANLPTVPVIVRDVDNLTQAQLALVENIQRQDLNPIDRAAAYKLLLDQLSLSHAELAQRLGEERSTVSNHLRLLELAESNQVLIRQGLLSLGHAKVLAGVTDMDSQTFFGKQVVEKQLSVRALEQLVSGGATSAGSEARSPKSSAHIRGLEKNVSAQLGMKVKIKSQKNGRGTLIVHYVSLDQFDELMSRMKVTVESDGN